MGVSGREGARLVTTLLRIIFVNSKNKNSISPLFVGSRESSVSGSFSVPGLKLSLSFDERDWFVTWVDSDRRNCFEIGSRPGSKLDGHSLKKMPFIGFHTGRKNVLHPIAPGTTACEGKTAIADSAWEGAFPGLCYRADDYARCLFFCRSSKKLLKLNARSGLGRLFANEAAITEEE
ncbi:unnamed protein product [Dovyalis caffra]|uniref:Uncharacterized protein n=1 Tax=Dovyalis caffra TaxID=77055 RepID=A0AAV1QWB1_9ROSI|nr:unnamed protein product [Dovyalis caffra]